MLFRSGTAAGGTAGDDVEAGLHAGGSVGSAPEAGVGHAAPAPELTVVADTRERFELLLARG